MLHLDDEGPVEPQVQETIACASSLRTNLNENEHKSGNEKEMVAPSPKKIAKFPQTSQHKKEPTTDKCEAKPTKKREVISNDDDDDDFE